MGKVVGNQEEQNLRQILDATVTGLCMNREDTSATEYIEGNHHSDG